MKINPKDLPKVRKFIYKFGYKTSIKDEMYPAYYWAWLLSIFGCDIDKEFIEKELWLTKYYMEMDK
jgi:hypothetical protein